MSNSLIIYSSTDGHTKNICERIINFSNDTNKVRMSISGNLNFDSSVATKARSVNRSVYNYE